MADWKAPQYFHSMRTCPECHSQSPAAAAFCSSCFYRFRGAEAYEKSRRWKYRLCSAAVGFGVAVLEYAVFH